MRGSDNTYCVKLTQSHDVIASGRMTLKEVAYELGTSYRAAYAKVIRGTFPIRPFRPSAPYIFDANDVRAYLNLGTVTNPGALIRGGTFARGRRAKALLAQRLGGAL